MGMQALQADLEQSQFKVKQMIASEEARMQSMQESREQQDIAGLGAELAAGRSQYETGMAGAIKGVGAIGSTLMGTQLPQGAASTRTNYGSPTTIDPIQTGVDTSMYADPNIGGRIGASPYGTGVSGYGTDPNLGGRIVPNYGSLATINPIGTGGSGYIDPNQFRR
ncbi:hypothetical protein MHBO_004767 [Bonamia ostreae]|uniref:Uncharacterized protein n=1 Tax=Bonamia ostreae TaxID=126728 RepID=A0ABV2AU71_9EUKA